MVGSNTSSDGNLELLCLCETLSSEITWMESADQLSIEVVLLGGVEDERCGDDNFSVCELLVELGVLALLVGGGDESVSLILEPFAETKLVLSCA